MAEEEIRKEGTQEIQTTGEGTSTGAEHSKTVTMTPEEIARLVQTEVDRALAKEKEKGTFSGEEAQLEDMTEAIERISRAVEKSSRSNKVAAVGSILLLAVFGVAFALITPGMFTLLGNLNSTVSRLETTVNEVNNVVASANDTAQKLNGWTDDLATGAELSVNNFDSLQYTADILIQRVNRTQDQYGNTYSTKTRRELSPQIFSWLDLLDLNVWIILAIMTAVAVVTMVSGLLIIILERTTMIGILKALGARNSTVRHTFLWFAAFIIGKGLIIGDAITLAIIVLQKTTGIVKLDPVTYYVDTVPVEINWLFIVALNIATLLIALFVLIAPSYLISHIHPAKSMRYE